MARCGIARPVQVINAPVILNAPDPAPEAGPPGEVFLSYHSPDRAALLQIRELLATRGIATFLDRDNLVAGMPWPQALEERSGRHERWRW